MPSGQVHDTRIVGAPTAAPGIAMWTPGALVRLVEAQIAPDPVNSRAGCLTSRLFRAAYPAREGTEGLDVCPLALRATGELVVADATTLCCLAPMFRPPRANLTVMRLQPNRAGGVHPEERVLADVAAKYRRSFVTCLLGDDVLGHTGRSSRRRKPGPRRMIGHVGGIEPDTSATACCSGSILPTRSRARAVISCLAYRGRTRSRVRRLLAPSRQYFAQVLDSAREGDYRSLGPDPAELAVCSMGGR